MLRTAAFLVAALAISNTAHAGTIAWTDADRAEIAKLAKKAKKNGDGFAVTSDLVEARLPTREAAAEFFLYFDRLAERVRPLWGTRESATLPLLIGMYPKDSPWPDHSRGKRIHFDMQMTKQNNATGAAAHIGSLNLWIDSSLSSETLTVSTLESEEMNSAGVSALLTRLCGENKRPEWLAWGMFRTFQNWSPESTTEPALLGSRIRGAASKGKIDDVIARNAPLDVLSPWFAAKDLPLVPAPREANELAFESFFVFLLEHKRGREIFVEACEASSRGKPLEIESKRIAKLIPHWRTWAEIDAAPPK